MTVTRVEHTPDPAHVNVTRSPDGTVVVHLAGTWLMEGPRLPHADAQDVLGTTPPPRRLAFETSGLGHWDSAILTYLIELSAAAEARQVEIEQSGLPSGIRRLLSLASAVPEREGAREDLRPAGYLESIGDVTLQAASSTREMLAFLGQVTQSLGRAVSGRARFRRSDLVQLVQQAGIEALPIVSLVSFLLGAILAFVGAVQLQTFGAAIYVADLVGVAMVRDMGALITAIVMAGRSGAAYAAQLGSMKVNQEIDALTTMAISPIDFLVLPRVLALCLMIPLLTLYANAVGILGGMAVGVSMLDISFTAYFQQTAAAIHLRDLAGGVVKAFTYGVIIAYSGSLRGMEAGKSSSAVGDAATAAVVMAIVLIIAAAGAYAFVFYLLGI
jgi:phospholipid/cholesterol/gamma-HCH transport system permease protein